MSALRLSPRRLLSLIRKEFVEILRDPSILFMGIGLPLLMLIIFGYGVSMDMGNVPAGLVMRERTPAAMAFARDLAANPQFEVRTARDRAEAETWLSDRSVEFVLEIPEGFARDLDAGRARVQLTLYGVDSNSALIFRNYAAGVLAKTAAKLAAEGRIPAAATDSGLPALTMTARSWFNDEANSRWYLVPGLLVVVSAVSASFMGSIVIAREWERGTMTSLFATPASALEILLSKWIPYAGIAYCGFLVCLGLAFLLFDEPLNGSLAALLGTALLFVAWAAAVGLCVSAKTKSQYLATEAAILSTFLPTMMLSGFIFDLRSVPAWIEVVGRLVPPTYAVESFKICFLSGGRAGTLALNAAVIALWTVGLLAVTLGALGKRPKRTAPAVRKNGENAS